MKLTLQDMVDDFRTAVGDDNFSEATIIRYLNKSQTKISKRLKYQVSLKRTMSTVADQEEYTIPSRMRHITDLRVEKDSCLPITKEDIERLYEQDRDNTGTVTSYWRDGNKIGLYYRPDAAAESTTLYANIISATATSLQITYDADIPSRGAGIVNSEVMYWTGKTDTDTTYSTLSGLTRGAEGTHATTHSAGDTFTWRDIEIFGFAHPSVFINKPALGSVTTQAGIALDIGSVYTYKMTFYSSSLEMESLPCLVGSITTTAINGVGALSSLAISTNPDVDYKKLYRTEGDGTIYYYVTELANATTTYTDSNTDATIAANSRLAEPYSQISEEYHEAITTYALFKYFRDVEEFTRSMEFKAEFEELINEALFDEYDKKFITYPQRPLAE